MSLEAAYTDIAGALDAALTAWPASLGDAPQVVWPNRDNVDVEHLQVPYVSLEIIWLPGGQLSMGKTKVLADYGQIHVSACVPEGSGSKQPLKMLDYLRTAFELKSFSVVRTHASVIQQPKAREGWKCTLVVIPLWIHRLVTTS